MRLTPFTKEDYYGFADAQPWSPTQPPLMGEMKVDGEPFVVIVDANGIGLIPANEGEGEAEFLYADEKAAWKCWHAFKALEEVTLDTLTMWGFRA